MNIYKGVVQRAQLQLARFQVNVVLFKLFGVLIYSAVLYTCVFAAKVVFNCDNFVSTCISGCMKITYFSVPCEETT